jgi:hypothetical protein
MASKAEGRRARKNQFGVKGGVIPPSSQVIHFSPAQWEEFIEAACRLRPLEGLVRYAFVKRLGGAGDGGRDVEARLDTTLTQDRWDLYQAKHYATGLTPTNAFPELAKFFQQLEAKTYPRPRYYLFCAPKGVGNDLGNMINNPSEFKRRFLSDWRQGKTGFKGRSAELTAPLSKLINEFDFAKIRECQTRDLIEWHALDRSAHHKLFGMEAQRQNDPDAPASLSPDEHVYVEQLLKAYGEQCGQLLTSDDVMAPGRYQEHFQDQRTLFYCAEGLKIFSRDLYGEEEFDDLLAMVRKGIRPLVNSPSLRTGLERLDKGTSEVSKLRVDDSVLASKLRPGDLPGTCHHLVNRGQLSWVK